MTAHRSPESRTAGLDVVEHGVVTHLFPAEEYGLLRTADGRELPFRRDSAEGEFERLNLGSPVLFREELTERGPEAIGVARAI